LRPAPRRKHPLTWAGRIRDTGYFRILHTEWLEMKLGLEQKLCASRTPD
jgi:hypothetical protein